MDKRVLLTVAICMGILFVWTKFFVPTPPHPQQQQQQQAQSPTETKPSAATPRKPGDPAVEAPAVPAGPPPTAQAQKPAEEHRTFEQPGFYDARFTTWGAAPDSWVLTHPQFKGTVTEPNGQKKVEQLDLVQTRGADLPLIVTFPQSDFSLAPDAAWTLVDTGNKDQLAFAWENEQVRVEKRFTFVPNSYELKMQVTVENKTDKPVVEHLQLAMSGHQDPNVKPGGMFSQRYAQTEGECHVNGKLKRGDLQKLLKENIDQTGDVRWIGIDLKYFLSAMAQASVPNEQQRCSVNASADGLITATLLEGERHIAPKQKTTYDFAGFMGPKFLHQLDAVTVGGQDAKLGDSVNYGWTEAIARPMLLVLKAVHVVVPNWGFAIVVLTILLKALTWWPTQKSMKSMREMAKLKPEVDKLKERYGDDKQKFNVAVMALYKERGINPVGGCLPMLIQMPIYIALYSMLGNSVELYRSSFLGWIHDLTAPDPYYVLPILTGVLMFVQQRVSPQTATDPNQKAMMYIMPVMFTAFSFVLPAGLTIYILTNTLLTMIQQLILNRGGQGPMGRPAVKPAVKPAKA